MNRLLILLILLVSSFGCSTIQYKYRYTEMPRLISLRPYELPKRVVPIFIDSNFTALDKLSIDNSINQWNYALNGQIILFVETYSFNMEPRLINESQQVKGFLILRVDSRNTSIPDDLPPDMCKITPNCKRTLAWADKIGGSIIKVVRDRIDQGDVQYILLHELGHLLGARHQDGVESLMGSEYIKFNYLCIDYNTILQVSKQYDLVSNYLNYCITKY